MPGNDASDPTCGKPAVPSRSRGASRTSGPGLPAGEPERDMKPLLFDPDWYLRQHEDVAKARLDPVQHYLDHGAGEGRNPNAFFDTRRYLAANADVRASPLNPFLHFVLYGFREGRDPCPPSEAPAAGKPDQAPPRDMTNAAPSEAPAKEKLRRTLLAAMFAAAAEAGEGDNRGNAAPALPAKASAGSPGRSGSRARKRP